MDNSKVQNERSFIMWSLVILIGIIYLIYKTGLLKAIALIIGGIVIVSFVGSFLGVLI